MESCSAKVLEINAYPNAYPNTYPNAYPLVVLVLLFKSVWTKPFFTEKAVAKPQIQRNFHIRLIARVTSDPCLLSFENI